MATTPTITISGELPSFSVRTIEMGLALLMTFDESNTNPHTITYKVGSTTGTLMTRSLSKSLNWTVPIGLANEVPNATKVECVITCTTHYPDTTIGMDREVPLSTSITLLVPSRIAPTINDLTITDPEDHAIIFAAYVQHKSRVQFRFKPLGSYGSTIVSYVGTVKGVTIPFEPVIDDDGYVSITSGLLNPSGENVPVTLRVTDSRGRTNTVNSTINIWEYESPQIIAFAAKRANASGENDDEGNCVRFLMNFTIAPIGEQNDRVVALYYKKKSATNWTLMQSGSTLGYEFNNVLYSTNEYLTSEDPYDFKIVITDYFGSVEALSEVPVAFTLMSFGASGRAVAFGKECEVEEGIEFDLPVYFLNEQNSGKVLWSGAYWMQASHTINLSSTPISAQQNGIVLVFSKFSSNVARDYQFNSFFVHKKFIELMPGKTNQFFMSTDGLFSSVCSKVLTISDTSITGTDNNKASGTANGITYDNSAFVLRYVIGV